MKDLPDWRKQIDRIDREILRLLNERAQYALEIGRFKKERGLPAWAPEREEEILRNVVQSNPGPLENAAVRRLFERIIDEARALERHSMEEAGTGAKES